MWERDRGVGIYLRVHMLKGPKALPRIVSLRGGPRQAQHSEQNPIFLCLLARKVTMAGKELFESGAVGVRGRQGCRDIGRVEERVFTKQS